MKNSTSYDTLPKYLVPEDVTLDTLDSYITDILREYKEGDLKQEDLLNHGDALEEFLWKNYGNRETLTFPKLQTNVKLHMCSNIIDWMNTSNEFGYLITPKDVGVLIDFLNIRPTLESYEKSKINLSKSFNQKIV
jgi:hypothetical protein